MFLPGVCKRSGPTVAVHVHTLLYIKEKKKKKKSNLSNLFHSPLQKNRKTTTIVILLHCALFQDGTILQAYFRSFYHWIKEKQKETCLMWIGKLFCVIAWCLKKKWHIGQQHKFYVLCTWFCHFLWVGLSYFLTPLSVSVSNFWSCLRVSLFYFSLFNSLWNFVLICAQILKFIH